MSNKIQKDSTTETAHQSALPRPMRARAGLGVIGFSVGILWIGMGGGSPLPAQEIDTPTAAVTDPGQQDFGQQDLGQQDLGEKSAQDPLNADLPAGLAKIIDSNTPAKLPESQRDQTVRFAFKDEKWKTVIDWFAEQLDLIVYANYSDYPVGTFTSVDGQDYSVRDALDQLNMMLMFKGYTLVRMGPYLVVINHSEQGIPADLIPLVSENDLDERGNYELVNCKFDITGLDPAFIESQVRLLVKEPRGDVRLLAVSDELLVRENGSVLRRVRDLVNTARANSKIVFRQRELKHIPFQVLMPILRRQFGMRDNENQLSDGTLAINVLHTETQPWISGTADKVRRVMDMIDQLDLEENRQLGVEVEGYVLKHYIPRADSELIYRILVTVFADRGDLKMTLSPDTEIIYVRARQSDHDLIESYLAQFEENALSVISLTCNYLTPMELVLQLKQMLGISTSLLEEESSRNKNLIFMEDSANDRVIVRGSKRMLDTIKDLALVLDPPPTEGSKNKPPYRLLQVDGASVNDLLDQFGPLFSETYGRPNAVQFKLPKDRQTLDTNGSRRNSGIRFPTYDREFGQGSFDKLNPDTLTDEQLNEIFQQIRERFSQRSDENTDEATSNGAAGGGVRQEEVIPQPALQDDTRPARPPISPIQTQTPARPVERLGSSTANASRAVHRSLSGREYEVVTLGQRAPASPSQKSNFSPSSDRVYATTELQDEEIQDETEVPPVRTPGGLSLGGVSVPGDPVYIEMTPNGLMLRSRDLEALDLAEQLLRSLMKESVATLSTEPEKTVFFLGYRPASEIAAEIEEILGIGGGGGGGGGGLGDMMGNMAQNMIPGGQMLAPLLGGGGGATSSPKTNGEVSLNVDNYLNAIIVYANAIDTKEIEFWVDLKDRPTAPHDPRIYGETRAIKIKYRDPQGVKDQVDALFAPYIRKPEGQGGGGGQPQVDPQALIRAMMGGRGGRGGGGGGGGSSEPAKPQIDVSVDIDAKLLLVKGPDYILDDVETFVRRIDYENAVPRKSVEIIPLPPGVTAEALVPLFPQNFGAGTQQTPQQRQAQQRPGQQPAQGGGGNADMQRAIQQAIQGQRGGAGGGGANFGGQRGGAGGGANFGGQRGGAGGGGGQQRGGGGGRGGR